MQPLDELSSDLAYIIKVDIVACSKPLPHTLAGLVRDHLIETRKYVLPESFPGARSDRSDGLKLMLPEGWIHVRASNTEPLLRLAAEGRSQAQVDALYERVERLLSDLPE